MIGVGWVEPRVLYGGGYPGDGEAGAVGLDMEAAVGYDGCREGAIINIEPDTPLPPQGTFSTGVHPWRSSEAGTLWPLVEKTAADPRIAAIGECGLDRLRGAPLPRQAELLRLHALLAERLRKPLIVHCVRAWAELLAAHRAIRPAQPWIIHGFRRDGLRC